MKRLIRIVSLITVITLLVTINGGLNFSPTAVGAAGDLTIDWGVPTGNPIFVVTNMLPGDLQERVVNVTNTSINTREVGVRGIKTSENLAFGSILEITIKEGATTIYGPVTLNQFFTASGGPAGLPLTTINGGATANYKFSVKFPESGGNQFQSAQVIFDLIIGVTIDIPENCDNFSFEGGAIVGTAGNDNLRGTSKSELIMGLEGKDKIEGAGGDDCIIGGDGNDKIEGGTGNDVIFGGEGNDTIDGGTGKDIVLGEGGDDDLRGGSDNDIIRGGIGNDTIDGTGGIDDIQGNEGNDTIKGGDGDDLIHGNDGNDKLEGGSDNDSVYGDSGTDDLKGGSGNDTLIGGLGSGDKANGNAGNDTCDAEIESLCELNP